MTKGDIHTVPHGDGWANEVEGGQRASNTSDALQIIDDPGDVTQ